MGRLCFIHVPLYLVTLACTLCAGTQVDLEANPRRLIFKPVTIKAVDGRCSTVFRQSPGKADSAILADWQYILGFNRHCQQVIPEFPGHGNSLIRSRYWSQCFNIAAVGRMTLAELVLNTGRDRAYVIFRHAAQAWHGIRRRFRPGNSNNTVRQEDIFVV
jgi:hypothetical protein